MDARNSPIEPGGSRGRSPGRKHRRSQGDILDWCQRLVTGVCRTREDVAGLSFPPLADLGGELTSPRCIFHNPLATENPSNHHASDTLSFVSLDVGTAMSWSFPDGVRCTSWRQGLVPKSNRPHDSQSSWYNSLACKHNTQADCHNQQSTTTQSKQRYENSQAPLFESNLACVPVAPNKINPSLNLWTFGPPHRTATRRPDDASVIHRPSMARLLARSIRVPEIISPASLVSC